MPKPTVAKPIFNPRPTTTRILVKPLPPEEFTESGLFIPASAQAPQNIGVVAAIGPDVKAITTGDRVVYGRYAGTAVELEDVEYVVLKEEDVLLVV